MHSHNDTNERSLSFRGAVDILWRRRVLLLVLVAIAGVVTFAFSKQVKPKYTATATLLLVAEPEDNTDKLNPTTVQKPLLTSDLPALVQSETVLDRFRQQTHSALTDDQLKTHIRARVANESNLLPIDFTDSSAAESIADANALASQTTQYYREVATSRFDSRVADFTQQLKTRARDLEELDRQLQSLAGAYPYVDTKDGDSSVYDRLVKLDTERDEISATMADDQAQAALTTKRILQAAPLGISTVTNKDAAYTKLADQYGKDLVLYRHAASVGTANYPGLAELQQTVISEARDVAKAREKAAGAGPSADATYVQAEADVNKAMATFEGDRAKLGSLNHEIDTLNGQLGSTGSAARVDQLRRERDTGDAAYNLLAGRLDQAIADRAEAASTGSLVTIDRARVASRQVWTTAALILIVLAVFSLWLAISIVFLVEALDERYRVPATIERVFGAPVIGNLGG